MARQINRLNARTLPNTPGRHADGGGLYLNVKDGGSRSWLFMYKVSGKRREMGLGSILNVTLADARARSRELQQKLHTGVDPLAQAQGVGTETFGSVAVALIESLQPSWKSAKHGSQWTATLKTHAASLWQEPVDAISTEEVLTTLNIQLPKFRAKDSFVGANSLCEVI